MTAAVILVEPAQAESIAEPIPEPIAEPVAEPIPEPIDPGSVEEKVTQGEDQPVEKSAIQVEEKPGQVEPQIPESPHMQKSADPEFDWCGLAYQLGLAGLAQEIVANSLLHSFQGENLTLN